MLGVEGCPICGGSGKCPDCDELPCELCIRYLTRGERSLTNTSRFAALIALPLLFFHEWVAAGGGILAAILFASVADHTHHRLLQLKGTT